ncbi:MAG: 3-deoxy-8-phosphooctulonate synthase [Nitrospiraceae bacterium]|nr:3-deoxy-8-phosphooctulonate synthase [Nitrospiraceae bacterium]
MKKQTPMKTAKVNIRTEAIGGSGPLLVIAGPCVIETGEVALHTAAGLKEICRALALPFVFKSSYDKANRSSLSSFRGPGMERGLRVLADIRASLGVPVISDVHSVSEVEAASRVLDALQIPAFLSRQTDLILAAGGTGLPVNIKKGQFLSPWEMKNVVDKFTSTGNRGLMLTERGTAFGYNNLVVDMRSIPVMRAFGYPVIFDATHSVQLPGGQGTASGGQREFALTLAKAAVAAGADGVFLEVHPEPEKALCDGPNMIALDDVRGFLEALKRIKEAEE